MEDKVMDNTREVVPNFEKEIDAIFAERREAAYNAIEDLMEISFAGLGKYFLDLKNKLQVPLVIERSAGGIPADILNKILAAADDDIPEWLAIGADGNKFRYMMAFLDYSRMKKAESQRISPNAFSKWDFVADEALLEEYGSMASSSEPVSWELLAKRMGRSVNAIKLRLEHLGVDLQPQDVGKSRFNAIRRPIAERDGAA